MTHSHNSTAVTHGRGAAAKLYQTIDRVPDIDSANEGGLKPTEVRGEITFWDVKFHYPSRPTVPVVKGLSINFEAGKTAALVGASGSGKSTIVSLVERFYDPVEGVVQLDGVNLKDLNPDVGKGKAVVPSSSKKSATKVITSHVTRRIFQTC